MCSRDITLCFQVLWIVRTENTQDLKWLDSVLLPSEPEHYKKVRIIGNNCFWTPASTREIVML